MKDVKEKHCYVALDFDEEMKKAANSPEIDVTYELPDGNLVNLGNERFRCPELLFNPTIIGREFDGIAHATWQSIMTCDVDVRRELYSNIVLCGGSSMFPGIGERMTKEIATYA